MILLAWILLTVLVAFVVFCAVMFLLGAWRPGPPPPAVLESREPREAVQRAMRADSTTRIRRRH